MYIYIGLPEAFKEDALHRAFRRLRTPASFVASLLISRINYRATLNFSHLHLILEPRRKTVPYF